MRPSAHILAGTPAQTNRFGCEVGIAREAPAYSKSAARNALKALRRPLSAGRSSQTRLIFRASPSRLLIFFLVPLALCAALRAGPPFLTDDPEPVDLYHWEFYVFGQGDRSPEYDSISGPAIELNYGVAPETQLHLIAPIANFENSGSGWAAGYGDTEAGIKFRFVDETDSLPQVGIFPMAELDTGNSGRGLGNGRTWYRLPIWLQKSWGPWTSYGGGGGALNSAPGEHNSGFAGWLVQRDCGKYLTLGTEAYWQGANAVGGPGSVLANFGGSVNFTERFNLLFSIGHSISGERDTVWYLGLYWTGGPQKDGNSKDTSP